MVIQIVLCINYVGSPVIRVSLSPLQSLLYAPVQKINFNEKIHINNKIIIQYYYLIIT